MMKIFALVVLFSLNATAYVPTVESLFRHGGNPDVTANGVSLTLKVTKMTVADRVQGNVNDASLLSDDRAEDHYRIFFTKLGDSLKVSQARYSSGDFSESSLEHKVYYPNFTAYTIKADVEQVEKGLFYALLNSLVFNNGTHMVNYLRSLEVPVRLNSDLINREKVEFLADYKRYLVMINKDRNARKTEVNPMRPDDSAARARAEEIMNQSMYVDTNQVKLGRDEGHMAWMVNAGTFEAVFSYKMRDLQRLKFKSQIGDFDIVCKDYWLANGTHAFPRFILVRGLNGQSYQIEVTGLRHYLEKEADLLKRLKSWDQILKGKVSSEPRPAFLL